MPVYRTDIRSAVADAIRSLPPAVKRSVKEAIRRIAMDPWAGDPLHRELDGRFKYRVRRYRIVYRIDRKARVVHILAVGHRRNIYEQLAEQLREAE